MSDRPVGFTAVRVALDPTPAQQRALVRHAGAARFAYNAALAQVKACLEQRAAEQSYGIAPELLTEVPWTLPALRRWWNQNKDLLAPWWGEQSKEAYNSGLDALAKGLKNWRASRSGTRRGAKVGFPRFKKRGNARAAFRYSTGSFGPAGPMHVRLPRIGLVKTHERLDRLADTRTVTLTVSRAAGRWYASVTIKQHGEMSSGPTRRQRRGGVVGVDAGITYLAVLSTGEQVPNPRPLAAALRRLRTDSRAHARTEPGSAGRRRAAARLARVHARVANIRRDAMHKLTTRLTQDHAVVVVEDLNVAGMTRNRHLARAVADTGMAEMRRQLAYKAAWHGCSLLVADRWYPSSKTCSACGSVKTKLFLAERTYRCEACGLSLDRDLNAALNLAALAAQQQVAGSGPETVNGSGVNPKTQRAGLVAEKPQPRTTTMVAKTGTAASQDAAARCVPMLEMALSATGDSGVTTFARVSRSG